MKKTLTFLFMSILLLSSVSSLVMYYENDEGYTSFYKDVVTENSDVHVGEFIGVYDPVLLMCRYPMGDEVKENNYLPQTPLN